MKLMRIAVFCVLSVAVPAGAPCLAAEPGNALTVNALDCEIEVPASFRLNAGHLGTGITFYAADAAGSASLRIEDLADGDAAKALGREAHYVSKRYRIVGHLTIEEQGEPAADASGGDAPGLFTIRSPRQKLTASHVTQAFVDDLVEHCMKTVKPGLLAVAQRRAAGCAAQIDVWPRMRDYAGAINLEPVFESGAMQGWRISGVKPDGVLGRNGVKEGDFLTRICGVSPAEVVASDGPVCCAAGKERSFSIVFRGQGSKETTVHVAEPR